MHKWLLQICSSHVFSAGVLCGAVLALILVFVFGLHTGFVGLVIAILVVHFPFLRNDVSRDLRRCSLPEILRFILRAENDPGQKPGNDRHSDPSGTRF